MLPIKQLFIKVENISTPIKSYQVFTFLSDPITIKELIEKIKLHYGFIDSEEKRIRLELWTGPIGSKRIQLNLYEYIPDKYDTIWVRGYILNKKPSEENHL